MIFESLRPTLSVPRPYTSVIHAPRTRDEDVLSSLLITALSRGLSSSSALAARACRLGSTSGGPFFVVAAPLANALPFVAKLRFVRRDAKEAVRSASPPPAGAEGAGFSGGRAVSDGPRERYPESSLADLTWRIGLGSAATDRAAVAAPLEGSNGEPRAGGRLPSMSEY